MDALREMILEEFRKGLQEALRNKLHSAYVYGAIAFDDTFPMDDIDFHVIQNDQMTVLEK
jgi:hypothetical protein